MKSEKRKKAEQFVDVACEVAKERGVDVSPFIEGQDGLIPLNFHIGLSYVKGRLSGVLISVRGVYYLTTITAIQREDLKKLAIEAFEQIEKKLEQITEDR